MTGELQVEATGETVGEAKWAALRELEQHHPGLDKSAVRFQVVTEGERGLLGVGYTPARVIAHRLHCRCRRAAPPSDESGAGGRGAGARARGSPTRSAWSGRIDVEETEDAITVDRARAPTSRC